MSKFSIIVVSFQAGEKLKKTVDSILEQTYGDFQVVVKDGGSIDGSVEALRKEICDSRVLIKKEPDEGIYDAMNQALSYAEGEYILFLNCGDVFYNRGVLKHVVQVIEENQHHGIYYGDVYHGGNNTLEPMPHSITEFTCYRHMPCHQSIFYHRKLFETRGYDTQYKIRGDYDHFLWAYCIKKVQPFYVGCTVATYEGGGYSESKKNRKQDKLEHKKITTTYIPMEMLLIYKSVMILTLAPLRGWIARNKCLGSLYSKCKKVLYRKA